MLDCFFSEFEYLRDGQLTRPALNRSLALFLGFWGLVSNVTSALLFQRLPDDPLHIATHLSIYHIFASALAVLGIIGAKKVSLAE